MSDGHFNRALLPQTSFQSGVRTGKAVMQKNALNAFQNFIDENLSELTDYQKKEFLANFKSKLLAQ